MTLNGKSNLDKVRAAWGVAAPEWVIVLAEACDGKNSGQNAIAAKLGVSGSMVNQVLANAYAGRLDKIEQKVRGELMGQTYQCPVLGEITMRKCVDSQSRAYSATNALRVELRHACPVCPNRLRRTA